MNRNKLIIGIIGLVVLAAAIMFTQHANSRDVTKYENTFAGESENWSAEMHSKGEEVFYEEDGVLKGDRSAQSEFKLTYKGELSELSEVERFEFGYKAPGSGRSSGMNFDSPPERKTFTLSGNSLLKEDDVIKVTVTWDGHTEEFVLKNKK
ncbi:hypothetical protein [Virgibacillus doumboii]|uniref:hypothetical protein n=1 Tax=Virgibacillus doumboii TaxID=2697503 RepID=UPI0013DEBADC|nr:hypothetical protein [Virgibacillus doumboii]